MNHAQIDHLLQVTAARTEPLTGAARTRDAGPPFDNVFRQASGAGTPPRYSDARPSSTSFSARPAESTSSSSERSPGDPDDADSPLAEPIVAAAVESSEQGTEEETPDDSTDEAITTAVAILAEQVNKRTAAKSQTDIADGQTEAVDAGAAHGDAHAKTQGQQRENARPLPDATAVVDVQSTDDPAAATGEQHHPVAAMSKSDQSNAEAVALTTAADATSETAPSEQQSKSEGFPKDRLEQAKENAQKVDAAQASAESTSRRVAAAASNPKASPAVERTEPAIKSDKKSTARVDAAARAAAAVDHPAPVVRTAESTATAPAVANVAPQLAAEASSAAASSTSNVTKGATESKPGILSLSRVDRSGAGGTRGAHRPGHSESTPHVDPARFVSRVARAVQTAQERGGPLQLRLSPPELGAMRIELSVNQGTLTATIETDNSNAKQVLLDNLPALRDRLADQNIKIERFDVDVRQDSSGNQQNYAPQDRDQSRQQSSAARSASHERRQSTVPTPDEPQPIRRTISSTSINVVA